MIRPPPRSTRTDTLFPYTTLFRSHRSAAARIRRLPGSVIRQTPLLRGVPGSIYSRKDWCNARRGRHHRSALRTEQGRAQVRSTTSLPALLRMRAEEHTSELQSLMRSSYAVFCLKKKNEVNNH